MADENSRDSILDRMLAEVSDKLDKREGSIIYDALAPAAVEDANIYAALSMIQEEVYADSASYYYLAKRAAERGVYPKEATYAVCKMVVDPADTSISVGDRFNLGTLNYTVTSVMDSGKYQISCETAGVVGNQQRGNLLVVESSKDLNDMKSAVLTEILIPGEDEEDVEVFRERYFESMVNEAFGGNKADYREKINQIDGVGASKTVRMWERGYNPSKFLPSNEVAEWFARQSAETVGADVYEWLSMVYACAKDKLFTVGGTVRSYIISSEFKEPSVTLVKNVQTIVDPDESTGEGVGIAPIGHVVKVMGVRSKTIDISFTAVYKAGSGFSALESSINNAVDDYFEELAESWSREDNLVVRKSQIEARLILLDGIIDISDTKLNGVGENIILDEDAVPVRGEVSG